MQGAAHVAQLPVATPAESGRVRTHPAPFVGQASAVPTSLIGSTPSGIRVRVGDEQGVAYWYTITPHTSMQKVMKDYSARSGYQLDCLAFTFGSREIEPADSAMSVGLYDRASVTAHVRQQGSRGASYLLLWSSVDRDDVLQTCFALISAVFFAFCTWTLFSSVRQYSAYVREASRCRKEVTDFYTYSVYQLSSWFVNAHHAAFKVIAVIFVFLLLVGSTIYFAMCGQGLSNALHKVVYWLVSPDTGMAEKSRMGAIIGLSLSVTGLLLFALTLSMIQDQFQSFLRSLKDGLEPIVEVNHLVVIGLTEDTVALVHELCYAYENEGGTTIAVLAQQKVEDAEAMLKAGLDLRGSKLLVRSGTPDKASCLELVAAQFCKVAILVPDRSLSKEKRDAYTLQALIALRTKKWPAQDRGQNSGRILVMVSLPANMASFEQVGGDQTDVLSLDHVVGNILVSASENAGLAPVVDALCGFEGSELYITKDIPKWLHGVAFQDAVRYYSEQVLVGVVEQENPNQPELCVEGERELHDGDRLMLLAEDAASLKPLRHPREVEDHPLLAQVHHSPAFGQPEQEKILFIGWSHMAGLMLLKLDRVVMHGSKVFSFDESGEEERKEAVKTIQHRHSTEIKNINVSYATGGLGSRWQLDDMIKKLGFKWWQLNRIFIITDQSGADGWKDDAVTMACAVQVRDLVRKSMEERHSEGSGMLSWRLRKNSLSSPEETDGPPIVMELHSEYSEEQVLNLGFRNYVVSASIPSKVMATVARQPMLKEMLRKIFSNRGNPVTLRQLGDYLDDNGGHGVLEDQHISFFQAQSIVARSRDVLIGWTRYQPKPEDVHDQYAEEEEKDALHKSETFWEINPHDKLAVRPWNMKEDSLVVISYLGEDAFTRTVSDS